jgi:hypothetical protein
MTHIAFSIQYAGLTLPIAKNEQGQEVTPLKPISDMFGLEWVRQRKRVTEGDYYPRFLGTCIVHMYHADGQIRDQICVLLCRVAAFLSGISPERVRAGGNVTGADFLIAKQTEWADALHDYEELGVAVNLNHVKVQDALRRQRAAFFNAIGVLNKTPRVAERQAVTALIGQMATELGLPYQPELPGT